LSNIPVDKWKGFVTVSSDISLQGVGVLRKTVDYVGGRSVCEEESFHISITGTVTSIEWVLFQEFHVVTRPKVILISLRELCSLHLKMKRRIAEWHIPQRLCWPLDKLNQTSRTLYSIKCSALWVLKFVWIKSGIYGCVQHKVKIIYTGWLWKTGQYFGRWQYRSLWEKFIWTSV
jgi:hypothetical protein